MLATVGPILAGTVEHAQILSMDLHADVLLGILLPTVKQVSLSLPET